MSQSSVVLVSRLRLDNARACFADALDRIPMEGKKEIRSVAIKINICEYRRAESGAVTHPTLLAALLDELHARYPGARLAIVENDATSVNMEYAFRLLGFEQVAREHDAELHNVIHHPWVTKPVPGGIVFQELQVPEILETCDLFINFAKLKTNALTKTTGCLKNIFAFLKEKRKVVHHGRIDDVLVDMNRVIKPDLCLVDGYIGMEGIGAPAFGRPVRCELLVAGANPVATDACSARIMGFRPLSVRHIKLCHKAGYGPIDYELQTEIPDFNYRRYKFRFEHAEYRLRNMLRRRVGMST